MGVHERLILACDDMLAAQHCFFQSANVSLELDFRFNGLGIAFSTHKKYIEIPRRLPAV